LSLFLLSPSSRRAWIEILGVERAVKIVSVALLAEGVDRNSSVEAQTAVLAVALLAEGVDRNRLAGFREHFRDLSPSSRRAWIEICWRSATPRTSRSPSSRRAWIEI